jgi:hypothetical protein
VCIFWPKLNQFTRLLHVFLFFEKKTLGIPRPAAAAHACKKKRLLKRADLEVDPPPAAFPQSRLLGEWTANADWTLENGAACIRRCHVI